MLQSSGITFNIYISILLLLATTIIFYFKWAFSYWERKQVPYLEPRIPFGNVKNPFLRKIPPCIEQKNQYLELKAKGVKHGGIYFFTIPVYIPIDLEYIKNILQSDFKYFTDRGRYYNEKDDPLSAHLFNIDGNLWKSLRAKLTPTFTTGKMKTMFFSLLDCTKTFRSVIEGCAEKNVAFDIQDYSRKFTTNVIGSTVYGIECNSFGSKSPEFRNQGVKFIKGSLGEAAKMLITYSFPELCRFMGIKRYDSEATGFISKSIGSIVQYRETNNIRRDDFLQILIDLKNAQCTGDDKNGKALTMNQLLAQCVVFFVGGFDTSASVITYLMYEISKNNDIQQKLRKEILNVIERNGNILTYSCLSELKYMQQVIDETLRKYPSLTVLNRKCIKTYHMPNTNVVIENGTRILIPLMGLHNDPEYYPEPGKFDPERFSTENKKERHQFAYLPFGEGPRNCIGQRFGQMQVTTALCVLLKDFKFSVNCQTKEPLEFGMGVMCTSKNEIWLNATKI